MKDGVKKEKKKQCYNCMYSGTPYKSIGMTEVYCHHPDNFELVEQGADGRDFIMNWNNTCEKHAFKHVPKEIS